MSCINTVFTGLEGAGETRLFTWPSTGMCVKAKIWVKMARGEIRSAVRILKMVAVRMLLGGYMSLSEHSSADVMSVWP